MADRKSFWAWCLESEEPSDADRAALAARLSARYGTEITARPGAETTLGPRSRRPLGSHLCHRSGGSTTWSSTEMIGGMGELKISHPPERSSGNDPPTRGSGGARPWSLRPD